jgi:hypothetical protein
MANSSEPSPRKPPRAPAPPAAADPMGETVIDGAPVEPLEAAPAPTRAGPVRQKVRRPAADLSELKADIPPPPLEDLQLGRDILDDTVADLPAADPEAAAGDADLLSILDRPDSISAAADASLHRYDPEAGKTNVAIKVRAVSEAVRNTLKSPFGKLLVAIPMFLAGIGLAIAAITFQNWPWIVAAGIVLPLGGFLMYLRYQSWLGHKRYMYRLLETLGEDVSDFQPHKMYRSTKVRAGRRR